MAEFLIPNEQDPRALAEALDHMNQQLNSGRGISAIHDIASMLKEGDLRAAKATIAGEWDKISSHKEIADWLIVHDLFAPVDFGRYLSDEE